jgi:hypothetical protein
MTAAERAELAEAFAAELEAATCLQQYADIVRRVLDAQSPGLLMTLVSVEQPTSMAVRLSALIATTRHRLDPMTAPRPAALPRRERPAAPFPRRSR